MWKTYFLGFGAAAALASFFGFFASFFGFDAPFAMALPPDTGESSESEDWGGNKSESRRKFKKAGA